MNMLSDARIWLSGSIPNEDSEEGKRIAAFVTAFAREVFRRGGTLVHGSHPTIVKPLFEAAGEYKKERNGEKPGLALLVSRYFSKEKPEKYGIDLHAWNELCDEPVVETREALPHPITGEVSKADSLVILRLRLLEQANAIVAVGGKWWEVAAAKAGVPDEIELARSKQLPLFLLGGLGGTTAEYLKTNRDLLRECRNGLNEEQNVELATIKEPADLAEKVVEAIARLPLQARSEQSGRPFRILCLDGGGICGTFTAAVLDHWEKATGRKIVDHFDLIAGTSTGGILAIGLGLGLSPAKMLDFYSTEGKEIFPNSSGIRSVLHSVRHWFAAKFDHAVLRAKMEAAFPATETGYLAESSTRLLIPAYDSNSDRLLLFRTPHGRDGAADAKWKCLETALATAAAPTYFDPVKLDYIMAVDGGVWANSPTTIALAEAIHELGVAPERIEMLSVGTTYGTRLLGGPLEVDAKFIEALLKPVVKWPLSKLIPRLFWKPRAIQGILGWLPNIAGFLMKTQAQTSEYVAERILGERFLRVDEAAIDLALDDVKAIDLLTGIGVKAAQKHLPTVKKRFLDGVPADPWRATDR